MRPPLRLSQTEAAYIAGLLDGEGSIRVVDRLRRRSLELVVVGTHMPMLEWLLATIGTGSISGPLTRTGALGSKDCRHYRLCSVAAADLLRQVEPYMIEKRGRALEAIALADSFPQRAESPSKL